MTTVTNQNLESNLGQLMQGKRGIIMGVANDKSLGWYIAKKCSEQGAKVAISYQDDIFLKRVEPLAKEIDAMTLKCDATVESSITEAFSQLEKEWGALDFVVHAIAFSDKNELRGRYVDTTLNNFLNTMHVSCYSFTSIAKYAAPLMKNGGSMLTLSYYGAEKIIPNYNVMGVAKAALEASMRYIAADLGPNGIRVNAISAGPVRTLAASGIADFRDMMHWTEKNTPLRRNIVGDDVGNAGLYLLSDLSANVTAEVLHVDSGYHAVGMKLQREEAEIVE